MKPQEVMVDGHAVRLTRRAYPLSAGGNKTFTWAEVLRGGEWVSLGDPWEKLRPSNAELLAEIKKRAAPGSPPPLPKLDDALAKRMLASARPVAERAIGSVTKLAFRAVFVRALADWFELEGKPPAEARSLAASYMPDEMRRFAAKLRAEWEVHMRSAKANPFQDRLTDPTVKARKGSRIALVRTRVGCAPMEVEDRYHVQIDGKPWGELYWNLTGYVGYLPAPKGGGGIARLDIGEKPISAYQRAVTKLNREWAQAGP